MINSRRQLPPKQCATAAMRSVNDSESEAAIQTARPAPVSVEESTRDGFRTPTEQRRKKVKTAQRETRKNETRNQKRGTIVGNGDSTGLTAVPPPDRDFFIWRVHKSDDINTLTAKDGDLRLSAPNACLPKTEISVFVTECFFFYIHMLRTTYVHIA